MIIDLLTAMRLGCKNGREIIESEWKLMAGGGIVAQVEEQCENGQRVDSTGQMDKWTTENNGTEEEEEEEEEEKGQ